MGFQDALKFVLAREGGYVVDQGGPTNHGITQKTYDYWRGTKNLPRQAVTQISDNEVAAIYQESYWTPCKCDSLQPKLALVVFDMAVNSGAGNAIKTLQSWLDANGFNPGPIDGGLGNLTMAAIQRAGDIASSLVSARIGYYYGISINSAAAAKSLDGWLNRMKALIEALATIQPTA